MKFVFLTDGHPHGVRILECLSFRPEVVLTHPTSKRGWAGYWRRRLTENTHLAGPLNSPKTIDLLHKLSPDYLLLGGCGILKAPLIETAKTGVLNSHPSLLPWLRGCSVVGRAIERGVAIGATCHLVDAGIDTGAILARKLLPVTGGESLAQLELANGELAAQLMADVIDRLPLEGVVQTERFPYCHWMSKEERRKIDRLVRQGRASELYEEWSGRDDLLSNLR